MERGCRQSKRQPRTRTCAFNKLPKIASRLIDITQHLENYKFFTTHNKIKEQVRLQSIGNRLFLNRYIAPAVIALLAILYGCTDNTASHHIKTHNYVMVRCGTAGLTRGYLPNKVGHYVVVLAAGSVRDNDPDIRHAKRLRVRLVS